MNERDVLALAKWLHTTSVAVAVAAGTRPDCFSPWPKLPLNKQALYHDVARELLTNPPPAICKAVRRLEA